MNLKDTSNFILSVWVYDCNVRHSTYNIKFHKLNTPCSTEWRKLKKFGNINGCGGQGQHLFDIVSGIPIYNYVFDHDYGLS